MAPTCKFFLQGNCRFGDNCRFEHPRNNIPTGNRFNALQPQVTDQRSRNNSRNRNDGRKYNLDRETIQKDLSIERPLWILSSYSPLRDLPAQLFGGAREQSFEELRVRHYEAAAAGNPQEAIQEALLMVQNAEQQTQNALNDLDGAINFILRSENEHPNRIDICNNPNSSGQIQPTPASAFGQQSNNSPFASNSNNNGAFGQPSGPLGAPTSNPFGQSTVSASQSNPFGAPNQPFGQPQPQANQPGAFGVPSQLGQNSNPFSASGTTGNPFSQGSQPQTGSNAFGAPTNTIATNAFGATTNSSTNLFGTTTNPPPNNVLSGSTSAPSNAFGVPTSNFGAPAPTFGTPSAPNNSSPFGATPASSGNPFGQPVTQPSQPSPFSQQPSGQQPQPFGQAPSAATNPFGGPSQSNPFGSPSTGQGMNGIYQQTTGFGLNAASGANNAKPMSNGHVDNNPYGPGATRHHPPISAYSSRGMNGQLTSFNGRPVNYRDDIPGFQNANGIWERIWFPEGPPAYTKETEAEDNLYDDQIKSAYEQLGGTGTFPGGVIPLLPPRREWCVWNF